MIMMMITHSRISISTGHWRISSITFQGQPFALQLQWTDGEAFTSWSGEVIRSKKHDPIYGSSSVIQLGKRFADSLGLDEDQQVTKICTGAPESFKDWKLLSSLEFFIKIFQVLVEPVVSIPSCNRISVDPISANDWEILVSLFWLTKPLFVLFLCRQNFTVPKYCKISSYLTRLLSHQFMCSLSGLL